MSQTLAHENAPLRKQPPPPGCVRAFFFVFFAAGCGVVTGIVLVPAYRTFAARNWPQADCTILSSEVKTHRGKNTTYSILIRYRYAVRGQEYESDRYDFSVGSTGGFKAKQEIVNQFPAGLKTHCFYDPDHPTRAVLSRELSGSMWFGLIGVPFLLIGLFGMVGGPRMFAGQTTPPAANGTSNPFVGETPPGVPAGHIVLQPKQSPLVSFLGTTFACVIWNGITSVFLWQVASSWLHGKPDVCMTLFILPFAAVGVLLVVGMVATFLALFNPRPIVTVSKLEAMLGETIELTWRFTGSTRSIRQLKVLLKGVEQAEYRRGTSTSTSTETFAEIESVNTTDPAAIVAGSTQLTVPFRTMHSFNAPHNRILWTIELSGEIRFWPDVAVSYPIAVTPVRLG